MIKFLPSFSNWSFWASTLFQILTRKQIFVLGFVMLDLLLSKSIQKYLKGFSLKLLLLLSNSFKITAVTWNCILFPKITSPLIKLHSPSSTLIQRAFVHHAQSENFFKALLLSFVGLIDPGLVPPPILPPSTRAGMLDENDKMKRSWILRQASLLFPISAFTARCLFGDCVTSSRSTRHQHYFVPCAKVIPGLVAYECFKNMPGKQPETEKRLNWN